MLSLLMWAGTLWGYLLYTTIQYVFFLNKYLAKFSYIFRPVFHIHLGYVYVFVGCDKKMSPVK